jgi:hypothetical protein
MTRQRPMIIRIEESWGGPGFETRVTDNETAYSIGFMGNGNLAVRACTIKEGIIHFDHNPMRGISINLKESKYEAWGLNPSDINQVFSLLKPEETSSIFKIRELLAALEHEQWSHWTKYFFSNLKSENIARWTRQAETPYKDLDEPEKDSDRDWADKVLGIVLRGSP